MKNLTQELDKIWKGKGWNEHEKNAYGAGYVEKYFSVYPFLKKKLLERTDNTQNKNEKRYYNALRIYIYTIFENLWYGYLISYSTYTEINFKLNNYNLPPFKYPFSMFLPFFSAAILHFGSCRDLFFVLLKLCIKDDTQIKDEDELRKIIEVSYYWETQPKLGKKQIFKDDLKKLSNEDENSNFIKKGKEFFYLNEFRNFFAHRMRLPWWRPEECKQETYFIKKSVHDIFKDFSKTKEDIRKDATNQVFNILEDPLTYEYEIEKADYNDLVSASQILQETHDLIASFFADFLKIMEIKLKNS